MEVETMLCGATASSASPHLQRSAKAGPLVSGAFFIYAELPSSAMINFWSQLLWD
jgi:hypothetical protein